MKILSIGTILGIGVLVSGCGLQVVKKDNLYKGLEATKAAVDQVRADVCSDEGKTKIEEVYAVLDGLIDKYGK